MPRARDAMERKPRTVNEDLAAGDAVVGRVRERPEWVGELVVPVERPVSDHQRNVAVAAREAERGVELVVDDPHPCEAAPHVARGALEAVVVVPLKCRAL